MKKFTNYFVTLSLAVAALFTTTSCNEDADVEVEVANPSVSAVVVAESTIGQTSATATVTFAEAEEIYYSVYESSSSASTWESVSVAATETSTSIKLSSLTAGTDYTVECYAENGDIKSTSISADFTTVAAEVVIPDPTIAIAAVEGSETIQFTVSVTNAVMYAYAYYLTSEAPAEAEIEWTETAIEADGDYTIDVDATVAGDYTIYAYAAGTEVDSEVTSATFTVVAPDPTIAIAAVEGSDSQFTVSVTDAIMYAYAYYLTSEAPAEALIEWTEVAVAEDGDYTIDVEAEAGDYTLFAYAGGMSANTEVVSIEFTIAEPVIITVSNANAASFMISMDVEIDNTLCDGFAYYSYQTAYAIWYAGYFEGDLTYGYCEEYITESKTIQFGSAYYLTPDCSYTFEIAAYKDNGDGTYAIVGDIITFVESTTAAVIGASDATIEIEIDDTKTSLTGFGGSIYNNDNVGGYCYGNVAAADASSGIDAYITANNIVSSAYYTTFRTYDWETSDYVYADSKAFSVSSKASNTEYIVYAIPVDNDGNLGKVCTANVTTNSLSVDSSIIPGIECTPSNTSAEFVFTFTDNCYKIFRYNGAVDDTWVTADGVYSWFLDDLTSLYYGWSKDSADLVDGKATYTQSWLSMGTEYNMYYLGVAEDGTLGALQTYNYTTTSPDFDASTASLNVTIDEKSQAYYWYDPVEYPNNISSVYANVTFNIEMTDGATSYVYGVFDDNYVVNKTSMSAYGSYLIGSFYNPVTTTAKVLEDLYFGASTYILVVVPIDAAGLYGTPQVIKFDGWDSPIYDSGDNEDEDFGVDPMM